jgi:hypothetical protein
MPAMRLCRSCDGPVPRASRRCPWCKTDLNTFSPNPAKSGASVRGKRSTSRVLPPPDREAQTEF